jgi:peptide-methionine (S)-S-oxide reductase
MTGVRSETATLAGGCFWCLEAVLEPLRGVTKVVSGYTGGRTLAPSYRDVCSGTTGHAEAVQIDFDPGVIPYRDLLELFFAFHDPTTLNRQGGDVGTQYRSAIFFHSPEQKAIAEQVIAELAAADAFGAPIVTELAPFAEFHPAEPHHRDYYRRNSSQPYCRAVISPKMAKLRARYASRLRIEGAASAADGGLKP